jgi:hypothetical protein
MSRRNPLGVALACCALLVIGGLVAMGIGYHLTARTLDVFDQVPVIVSGGLGGIALVITGCVFGYVQVARACAESERLQEAALLPRIAALANVEKARIEAASAPAPKGRRTTAKQGAA